MHTKLFLALVLVCSIGGIVASAAGVTLTTGEPIVFVYEHSGEYPLSIGESGWMFYCRVGGSANQSIRFFGDNFDEWVNTWTDPHECGNISVDAQEMQIEADPQDNFMVGLLTEDAVVRTESIIDDIRFGELTTTTLNSTNVRVFPFSGSTDQGIRHFVAPKDCDYMVLTIADGDEFNQHGVEVAFDDGDTYVVGNAVNKATRIFPCKAGEAELTNYRTTDVTISFVLINLPASEH